MNGYQFIASLFRSFVSLAWPAALVVVAWLFRRQLGSLLPFLRLKYKDLDVSFRLNQAEKEALALPKAPEEPETVPTPEEERKFRQIAEVSPRAAVLEARLGLEEVLRSVAQATGEQPPRTRSLLDLTRLLRSRGAIDEQTSALLDDLRVIGNTAAHDPDAAFSADDAIRFRVFANTAIDRMRFVSARSKQPKAEQPKASE